MTKKTKEIIRVVIAFAALVFLFYPYFIGDQKYMIALGVITITGICIAAISLVFNLLNQKGANKKHPKSSDDI